MSRQMRLPATMRAAAIDRPGGPAVLKLHVLPLPELDPGEVLIAVHTAGVGSWDADLRGGWFPGGRPRFPLVLGTDGAGTVAAVGSRVRRFAVGQRVISYHWDNMFGKGGFYAEYVAVPAENVAPVPRPLDLTHAGAVPATGLTALQGVDDALHLKRGETVIVHGASGAVGTLAVLFAKRRGARVFASASGDDGAALMRRLGADASVNSRRADLAEALRRFAPAGADALLAFAGGRALTRCIDALRRDGRIAYPHGIEPAPRKRRGIAVTAYDAAVGMREFERFNRAVTAARLQVPIGGRFPLARAADAHRRLAGHVLGRIVLRIRP